MKVVHSTQGRECAGREAKQPTSGTQKKSKESHKGKRVQGTKKKEGEIPTAKCQRKGTLTRYRAGHPETWDEGVWPNSSDAKKAAQVDGLRRSTEEIGGTGKTV